MDEDRLVKRKQRAKRDSNMVQLSQVSKELGDMYFETGRLKDALLEYNDQLMACEVLNERLNCAIAHRMIGEVHASLGDYDDALTHQMLHLEGAREAENLLEQQRALATIGRTYFCQAQALPEESAERKEACVAAKKAYSKSLRLCNDLENTDIGLAEMMTMRARLLLNLGLVLEEQKEFDQAVELIEKAAELFKKHKVLEDLHRTHLALGALHERQGHFGVALKHIDQAIAVDDSSLKTVGQLTKAELLLRIGQWSEARQILVILYLSKDVSITTSHQVQRLLRIVVSICRAEDSLDVECETSTRRRLYESLGDAAAAVRAYEKALEYYGNMLICAEKEDSLVQISAALVSLVQTYRDVERYDEALPYARRELSMCEEPTEICRSALNLADLLHLTRAPRKEVMEIYELASENARKCGNDRLEASVLNDAIIYLEETSDHESAEKLRERLRRLDLPVTDTATSENESENANIGADICLEDLSDVEVEMRKRDENSRRNTRRNTTKRGISCGNQVIKRNAKGETKLHVACIAGNIDEVARLLEVNHPTDVRDYCGWTPLHEAANHGHVEIAELLIKSGANVDDPGGPMCGGVTPLHDAASCGHFSIVCLLMKSGANLLAKTRDQDTVIDCLEAWRERAGTLSPSEQAEYDNVHSKLVAVVPRNVKRKTTAHTRRRSLEDSPERDNNRDGIAECERISAGEDYRRTIENLKNRYRSNGAQSPRVASTNAIPAPLVDSQDIMIDDWLEDDLNSTVREKTLTEERTPVASNKRRSLNTSQDNHRIVKRPRNESIDAPIRTNDDHHIDESSRDSTNSDSSDVIYSTRKIGRFKKKSKQLSLLKSGFTRDTIPSRTPSPIFNYDTEIGNNRFERISECISETVKLQIRIGEKVINLKLRFPEQRETTVDSLVHDAVEKFEAETGCRVQVTLKTMSGDILLREDTLRNVRAIEGVVRLVADIVDIEVPPIVERYGKVCKCHHVESREIVLRCLKICDNTSTFRVNSGQVMDNEIAPLLQCLEYQEKLQVLQLSGASLYESGNALNGVLKRLSTLQELHLQGCDIDHNCLTCIERLPGQLRILDLSYNPLGKRSESKLHELLSRQRHLQTLNLRFCRLTRFASSDEWSSLVNLDLSSNPLAEEVTRHLLQRQILSLNLSYSRDKESVPIARELLDVTTMSLRTLECLELSCCDLTDTDVVGILSRASNLSKFVAVGNVKLTKKSVEALLKRRPSLTHVDVAGGREIVESPDCEVRIDNPRVCTLRVSMSSEVVSVWLALWTNIANAFVLPHNVVTFEPIVR